MRTKHLIFPLSILAVLVLILGTACAGGGGSPTSVPEVDGTRNPGTSKRPRGAFTLAAPVELSKGPWSGPLLKINKPGHPMNGLEIRDKNGYLAAGTELTVSSAAVTSHSFGDRFSKIMTPVITVEGASRTRGPIRIRIPRPAGYNDDCDVVSVDPLESFLVYETVAGADSEFIDVVLYKIKVAGAAPKRGDQGGIVVVESKTPNNPTELPEGRTSVGAWSGFLPGQHDWPFRNWGSYPSPGGDCTGMSLSAAYIFAVTTGPRIRGDVRFTEDTFGFTADDRDARRLCGKVQKEYEDAEILGVWSDGEFITPLSPASLVKNAKKRFDDGVPCALILFSTTHTGGHAVITFAAGSNNLLIADPNYPGQIRHLTSNAAGTQWNPFSAQLNAGDTGNNYDLFFLVDPMKFADELEPLYQAAIAGDAGADAFDGVTSYTLQDYCSKKITVRSTDNFVLENPDLKFFPTSEYLIGLQDQDTGVVEEMAYFHRTPGGTVEGVSLSGNLQMINLEKGVFDPEDEECDFCTNMIPHRTKRPLDVDVRLPLYKFVDGQYAWFDSINIKVKMKPMELDPNAPRGVSKP